LDPKAVHALKRELHESQDREGTLVSQVKDLDSQALALDQQVKQTKQQNSNLAEQLQEARVSAANAEASQMAARMELQVVQAQLQSKEAEVADLEKRFALLTESEKPTGEVDLGSFLPSFENTSQTQLINELWGELQKERQTVEASARESHALQARCTYLVSSKERLQGTVNDEVSRATAAHDQELEEVRQRLREAMILQTTLQSQLGEQDAAVQHDMSHKQTLLARALEREVDLENRLVVMDPRCKRLEADLQTREREVKKGLAREASLQQLIYLGEMATRGQLGSCENDTSLNQLRQDLQGSLERERLLQESVLEHQPASASAGIWDPNRERFPGEDGTICLQ